MSTATALFIGASGTGPLDQPILIQSHREYVEHFGDDATVSDMSRQVRLFFLNGGTTAYAMRISAGAADTPPLPADYAHAYDTVARDLDLFNLLVLPQTHRGDLDRSALWGPASAFCERQRAFLLVDPPASWRDAAAPLAGVDALRAGLVRDHAAIHFPDLVVEEDGTRVTTSAAGAIAGLMARTDTERGVWKAAAGTHADIRGIVDVAHPLSSTDSSSLNRLAVNAIRRFPTGILNWGARTLDGGYATTSEYRYIPVRRLTLFLAESVSRGLGWTALEPNGPELWAAIRLNVGNFLNGLFRKGAFAGSTVSQAYYVKCDAETTTPTDRSLGVVNVHIGIAALKPAEFVVLSFRQVTLPEQ